MPQTRSPKKRRFFRAGIIPHQLSASSLPPTPQVFLSVVDSSCHLKRGEGKNSRCHFRERHDFPATGRKKTKKKQKRCNSTSSAPRGALPTGRSTNHRVTRSAARSNARALCTPLNDNNNKKRNSGSLSLRHAGKEQAHHYHTIPPRLIVIRSRLTGLTGGCLLALAAGGGGGGSGALLGGEEAAPHRGCGGSLSH